VSKRACQEAQHCLSVRSNDRSRVSTERSRVRRRAQPRFSPANSSGGRTSLRSASLEAVYIDEIDALCDAALTVQGDTPGAAFVAWLRAVLAFVPT
jgi:hypothetical protein